MKQKVYIMQFPSKIQAYIDNWFKDDIHYSEDIELLSSTNFYCHNCKQHKNIRFKSNIPNKYTRCIECTKIVLKRETK